MLQIPIFIPSRSRAFRLQNGTLSKLPKSFDTHIGLVVPADQQTEYDKAVNHLQRNITIFVCPENGIAATRHWIGKEARRLGCDRFIMCDDDLTDWGVRIAPDDTHLRKATDDDILEAFEWIQDTLHEYAHCSISPRGNNLIRFTSGPLMGPKPLTLENVRTLRLLAYQTTPFLSMEHGRVPIMEDFDVNLQLLEHGYKNIQSYHWTQDQRQTALPGGCSDYRDHLVQEEGARKLQEFHPTFVKLRKKINKSNVTYNKDFTERTEVTISWKKAYQSSQKVGENV